MTHSTTAPAPVVVVSISRQELRCGELCFRVSTGANGVGTEEGSGKTPLGRFRIHSRHGENAPLLTVFRGRLPVGLYPQAARGQDAILTRILTLDGLEPANANTRARYIYLHATPEVELLGTPASHGCIRLSPQDMLTLFAACPIGTEVRIER